MNNVFNLIKQFDSVVFSRADDVGSNEVDMARPVLGIAQQVLDISTNFHSLVCLETMYEFCLGKSVSRCCIINGAPREL